MMISNPREESKAILLKEQIDSGEIEPTHDRVYLVCKRLLRIRGWDAAYSWVEETYGEKFNKWDSFSHLETIVEQNGMNVNVPNKTVVYE